MKSCHAEYEIEDGLDRIDFERVHGWLSTTYWSPGIAREKLERAAQNCSMVVGAYCEGVQVGYLRVISDRTTFAWIADVFVDEGHRKKGIGKAMVQFALDHPEYQGLRRWVLATRDAHSVYEEVGFIPLDFPERWMLHYPAKPTN